MKNELYDEIRYNQNTTGEHIEIINTEENLEKKYCGAISILSLMTICHNYEKAENEVEDKTPINVIYKMFDNAQNETNSHYENNEMRSLIW